MLTSFSLRIILVDIIPSSDLERNQLISGSEIAPYNKVDISLVVYRFSINVITSKTTLRTQWQKYTVFTAEMRFQSNPNVI